MNATKTQTTYLNLNLGKESDGNLKQHSLKRHAGSIIESIIRKQGHNISKLARYMKISRCTLYNWFEQDNLPYEVLVEIGSCINYDFSQEFPEVFSLNREKKMDRQVLDKQPGENRDVDYWMRKYILLLEEYNECLMNKENEFNKPF
ncbi:helix-turn-helix domain-containing protein [Pedobacter sp. B4-66]|uniref:helix-turn-helix domain-containing protein n=1 Tax=Pedobacter sp. B4-66 TaxID=2817280 RepID=UPI001BDA981A|nr:helix-turn-helix domain-containing protein [Pedobacter sp. B4-66]